MIRPLALALCASAAACAASPRCNEPEPRAIVGVDPPDAQLRSMLQVVIGNTHTRAMIVGREGGSAKLAQAIDRAVERHRDEWRRNQELGWSSLNKDELQAACTAINQRDRESFMKLAAKVGPIVQGRNEPLLRQAAGEVLEEAF